MSAAPSLWTGLSEQELLEINALNRPLTFASGEELFHQGQRSTGMMVVRRGTVQLLLELPGGAQTPLCRIEPGEFLGELALLAESPRSATAVAVGAVEVDLLERQDFQSLRHARRPSSFRVMYALAQHMAGLIRNADAQSQDVRGVTDTNRVVVHQAPLGSGEQPGCNFDPRPFLDHLPFFRCFSPTDQSELLERGTLWQLPRGRVLAPNGDRSPTLFLVIRGAVEALEHGSNTRIALVGPGGMVGQLSPLLGCPEPATYRMRESGTVLELEETALKQLFHPTGHLSYRFLDALCARLLTDIRRANQVRARAEGTRRRADEEP